jgi:hypothetical protein
MGLRWPQRRQQNGVTLRPPIKGRIPPINGSTRCPLSVESPRETEAWHSTNKGHRDTGEIGAVFGERDPRSEIAAEDFVIRHLVEQEGFRKEDCIRVGNLRFAGNKREGFDIRAVRLLDEATGQMEVRRIEVKGRRRGGNIVMTTNEWYKAQQLGETYWLYVVWDPLADKPELVRIQHPAEKLDHAKREIVASRFYEIPSEAINRPRIVEPQ